MIDTTNIKGFKDIRKYVDLYQYELQRNPWSIDRINILDVPVFSAETMVPGKIYLISRGTYVIGSRGHGLYFGSIIKCLGEGKFTIINNVHYYGSGCFHTCEQFDVESFTGEGWELDAFIEMNAENLKDVIERMTKTVDAMKAEKQTPGEFDPDWGMN